MDRVAYSIFSQLNISLIGHIVRGLWLLKPKSDQISMGTFVPNSFSELQRDPVDKKGPKECRILYWYKTDTAIPSHLWCTITSINVSTSWMTVNESCYETWSVERAKQRTLLFKFLQAEWVMCHCCSLMQFPYKQKQRHDCRADAWSQIITMA